MHRVLVLADGSESSDRAVKALIRNLAEFRETPDVHLMNVQHPFPGTVHVARDQSAEAHRQAGLDAMKSAHRLLDEAGIQYTDHVCVGDVAAVVAEYVDQNPVDQIVMGTHGRSAAVALLLGSTASEVIRLVDVPVLLVK